MHGIEGLNWPSENEPWGNIKQAITCANVDPDVCCSFLSLELSLSCTNPSKCALVNWIIIFSGNHPFIQLNTYLLQCHQLRLDPCKHITYCILHCINRIKIFSFKTIQLNMYVQFWLVLWFLYLVRSLEQHTTQIQNMIENNVVHITSLCMHITLYASTSIVIRGWRQHRNGDSSHIWIILQLNVWSGPNFTHVKYCDDELYFSFFVNQKLCRWILNIWCEICILLFLFLVQKSKQNNFHVFSFSLFASILKTPLRILIVLLRPL